MTIKITVGGTTVDAYPMVLQGANQMSFLVGSNTPVGTGTITVTYNGAVGTGPITILPTNFGIFTTNFSGQGPGVFLDPTVTDAVAAANKLTNSAQAGQLLDIWGTGLGAATTGDELAGPIPGPMATPVSVWVGGQLLADTDIQYKGRSGCCAGIDQIRIKVPANITGCHVPVLVQTGSGGDAMISNTVTMAIATEKGEVCSDPVGLTAEDITKLEQGGTYRVGNIALSRSSVNATVPVLGTLSYMSDTASASFNRYDATAYANATTGVTITPFGSCNVYMVKGDTTTPPDQAQPTPLDAGAALSLTGPKGTQSITKGSTGSYSANLGGGIPGLPGTKDPYLDPGTYTITGPGGTDVGGFTAQITVPQPLTVTNFDTDTYANIPRNQNLSLAWTGGGENDYVYIFGLSSITEPQAASVGFYCYERASVGHFTVPSQVLMALPASPASSDSSIGGGLLSVGSTTAPVRFTATGLDQAAVVSTVSSSRTTNWQ